MSLQVACEFLSPIIKQPMINMRTKSTLSNQASPHSTPHPNSTHRLKKITHFTHATTSQRQKYAKLTKAESIYKVLKANYGPNPRKPAPEDAVEVLTELELKNLEEEKNHKAKAQVIFEEFDKTS